MAIFYIWPDDTVCYDHELEEHLTYMSDDFIVYESEEDDLDTVPSYDELTVPHQR